MRHYDTGRELAQARIAGGVALEHGAQVGALGEIGIFRWPATSSLSIPKKSTRTRIRNL